MVAKLWASRLEKNPPDPTYNNFNQVPAKLQDQVRAILEEDGYIIMPDGSVVKGLTE